MSRSPVTVRAARPEDVASLREIWHDVVRKGQVDDQLADLAAIVAQAARDVRQSVVVAEYDGTIAGAVYLQATTLTPLNLEPAVFAVSPHVVPKFRRKGVGSALMDAAVRFAEQHGINHVLTGAKSDAREANRFMARLAFAPQATLRAATTAAIRTRLSSRRPAGSGALTTRQIDRVLAARRVRRERVRG